VPFSGPNASIVSADDALKAHRCGAIAGRASLLGIVPMDVDPIWLYVIVTGCSIDEIPGPFIKAVNPELFERMLVLHSRSPYPSSFEGMSLKEATAFEDARDYFETGFGMEVSPVPLPL
jgi:hypothetical protein